MKNPLTTEKLVGCSVLGIAPLFTGPAMACIGRYTVRLQMVLKKVALKLKNSVSNLGSAVKTLNKEVQQLRTFSLQNRLALDYLLASQGGVCALVGPQCCVYVNDSSYEIYKRGYRLKPMPEPEHRLPILPQKTIGCKPCFQAGVCRLGLVVYLACY
ncbi:unnamed protein product [Lepidochelys olivacea]